MLNRLNNRIKLSNELILKIAQIDELKGEWKSSLFLSPKILNQFKKAVIINSSASSNRIEGLKISDKEVEKLFNQTKQTLRTRDDEEVFGYIDLLNIVFDNFENIKINEGIILEFHKIMLSFSKKDNDHAGRYKDKDNIVGVLESGEIKQVLFKPTPPFLVKKEMNDLIEWYKERQEKKDLHPLVIIANFIFEFLAIHPFIDGNGRLSRVLTNLMMLQYGYLFVKYVSLEEIIEEKQDLYYLSLNKTQKNHKTGKEDITPWLTFFIDSVLIQANKALTLLNEKENTRLLSESQRQVFNVFDKDIELRVSDIKKVTKIPLPTIKQAVSKLVEHNLVERIGQGSATRYRKIKN
jgi:Fic family protein